MSGVLKEKIGAVLIVALMVLPLAPVGMLAQGQITEIFAGIEVYTLVASGGAEITFAVNMSFLRSTFGWVATQVQIYLDDTGLAQLGPNAIPLTGLIDVAFRDYVVGTVRLPPASVILSTLTNIQDNKLYLKVFGGGNQVAASNPFIFMPSTAGVISFNDDRYAYFTHPLFGANSTLVFTVNVTLVNALLSNAGLPPIDLTQYNLTAELISDDNDQTLLLYQRNVTPPPVSSTSEVLQTPFATETFNAPGTVFNLSSPIGDFPLIEPENQLPAAETRGLAVVNFERFQTQFLVQNTTFEFINVSAVVVDEGTPVVSSPLINVTDPVYIAALTSDGFIDIFPSADIIATDPTISGPTTSLNVFDNITVEMHNFQPNKNISVSFYWFFPDTGTYQLVPGTGV
ncbi:MAG: hypothetical protein LRS43_03545, partial [Desulfurococcales archaeon]|nr:hypothetical protein [Desulfurococcales archaeon]